jgi:pimeloyl-ACP methyl ester carboxylesterase
MIDAATPTGIAAVSRGMAQRRDATELLSTITFPTQVIVGEHDQLTPPSLVRQYVKQIPGASFEIIPQAGHLSSLEQPAYFLEIVHRFLATIANVVP